MTDQPIPAPTSWRHLTDEHTDANAALRRIEESKSLRDQMDAYNRCAADYERRYGPQPLDLTRDYEAELSMSRSEIGFLIVVGLILVGIIASLLFQSTPLGRWIA